MPTFSLQTLPSTPLHLHSLELQWVVFCLWDQPFWCPSSKQFLFKSFSLFYMTWMSCNLIFLKFFFFTKYILFFCLFSVWPHFLPFSIQIWIRMANNNCHLNTKQFEYYTTLKFLYQTLKFFKFRAHSRTLIQYSYFIYLSIINWPLVHSVIESLSPS